jgi:hypothetical protein
MEDLSGDSDPVASLQRARARHMSQIRRSGACGGSGQVAWSVT